MQRVPSQSMAARARFDPLRFRLDTPQVRHSDHEIPAGASNSQSPNSRHIRAVLTLSRGNPHLDSDPRSPNLFHSEASKVDYGSRNPFLVGIEQPKFRDFCAVSCGREKQNNPEIIKNKGSSWFIRDSSSAAGDPRGSVTAHLPKDTAGDGLGARPGAPAASGYLQRPPGTAFRFRFPAAEGGGAAARPAPHTTGEPRGDPPGEPGRSRCVPVV